MELVKSIDVGNRYAQTFKNGSTKIALKARTENPKPAKIVDALPTLTKEQEAVRKPVSEWVVTEDGVQVVYEVKTVKIIEEPIAEKSL